MRILFVCLFALVSMQPAFGDENEPKQTKTPSDVHQNAVPSLVNLTSLPSAVVNGCVNVITGDLCEYDQDDVVSGGPDPYILGHSYASSSLEEGNLGDGWNFLHHHFLEVYQPARIEYVRKSLAVDEPFLYPIEITPAYQAIVNPDSLLAQIFDAEFYESIDASDKETFNHPQDLLHGLLNTTIVEKGVEARHKDDHARRNGHIEGDASNPIFLSLYDPSGGRLLYKTEFDEEHKERSMRHFELVTKNSGFTNITHGVMSGQTNVKNIKVKWDKKDDRFHVTLGDGTERVYERQWKLSEMKKKDKDHAEYYRDYQLHKEKLPNGHLRVYHYNDKHEITEIITYNSNFTHKLNEITFHQKTTGQFAKHPSLDVTTSDKKRVVYSFKRLKGSHMHGTYSVKQIKREGLPATHFTYSKYKSYHKKRVKKKYSDDGSYIHTNYYGKSNAFAKNRVRSQSAPVGPNGQKVTTHRYHYYKDGHGGAHAKVLDAYNNSTRYYWNKDKRLIRIKKTDSSKKLLMLEEFIWGENGHYNEGHLRAHIVKDEHGKTRLVRKFNYDGRGNVLEDILLARITENAGDIEFKEDLTHSETCDKVVTRYTYSDDGFNLKESECDPLGNYTYYEYYKGTNLLKAKYTCEEKHVRKREFFTYDENAILTEHIVDDGHSKDKENLDKATERRITRIIPRLERPHFGEPQQIDEFYYDFDKNERVWFKRTVNYFNSLGQVEKQEHMDRKGHSVFYQYEYDDIGRLIRSKNPLGHTETFTYDKKTARLLEKKGLRDDVAWHYSYDPAGRITKETEKHKDGLELTTEYEYDFLNRKTAVKDPYGNITRYEYDALDRVTKITYPDIYDHKGNKKTPTKTYSYTNLGSKVTETNELGLVTKTTYNAIGKITDQEFADGSSKHYFYDLKGNLVKEVAQNGATTYRYYDAFDRLKVSRLTHGKDLLERKEIVYSAFHPIQEIGPTGETITYTYDYNGQKIAQEQDGRKTTFKYDNKIRLKEERTLLDNGGFIAKSYEYDDLNRLSYEKLFDHKQETRAYKIYGYDAEGNQTILMQNIDGKDAKSKASFHPHGLPEEHTDAEGHTTFHKYYHEYINNHGQGVLCKETIDARGCIIQEILDARGNLSELSHFDPLRTLLAKKQLFYDKANNCIRIEELSLPQNKTIVTTFEYTNGHLTAITEAQGEKEEKKTRYVYNKYGELETTIHAGGNALNHRYDKKGRLTHFYSNDYTIDYTYTYDDSDRILEVKNNATGKKTQRTYNSFGELTSETLENDLTLSYDYDRGGRVKALTLPDGSQVRYSHSAYLDTITRLDDTGGECYKHKILDRDLSGFTQSAELAHNAGTLTFTRDKLGRTTAINHPHFKEAVPQNGFDPVGNLLKLHSGTRTRTFTYDYLSQLILEEGPTSHAYVYDSLYNRLQKDDDKYKVNSLHSVLSDTAHTYKYDPRGNRTKKDKIKYTYDALDRLTSVTIDNKHYTYSYDAFNRRIKKECTTTSGALLWKSQESTTERYIYAQENEIGAYKGDRLTELRILGEGYGAEIGAAIAIELNGQTYIPLHDRQGNITTLLTPEGSPIDTYTYDAFGQEEETDAPLSPWRFSSKRHDPETGLVYFGRRYYDPALGKWLTQDPLGLKAGPNLYAYCLNCPMTRFDTYGLLDETTEGNSNDRGFFSGAWSSVKDWADKSFSKEGLQEALRDEMRGEWTFDIMEKAELDIKTRMSYTTESTDNLDFLRTRVTESIDNLNFLRLNQNLQPSTHISFLTDYLKDWVLNFALNCAHKGKKSNLVNKNQSNQLPSGHIWTKSSPFKNRPADQLHEMFLKKGYKQLGPDPKNGLGNYVNPKNGRQFHIDPKAVGRYREPNHVDVSRPKGYNGPLEKKRFSYADD